MNLAFYVQILLFKKHIYTKKHLSLEYYTQNIKNKWHEEQGTFTQDETHYEQYTIIYLHQ